MRLITCGHPPPPSRSMRPYRSIFSCGFCETLVELFAPCSDPGCYSQLCFHTYVHTRLFQTTVRQAFDWPALELHFVLITPPLNSSTNALSIYLKVARLFSFPPTSELGHQWQTQQPDLSNEVKVKCFSSLMRKLQQQRQKGQSVQGSFILKVWLDAVYVLLGPTSQLQSCSPVEVRRPSHDLMNDRWCWAAHSFYLAEKTFC